MEPATANDVSTASKELRNKVETMHGLHVRFRRPMTSQSGTITAVGRVEHHGRSTAVSAGEVRDGEGRILATATASLFALRNPGDR